MENLPINQHQLEKVPKKCSKNYHVLNLDGRGRKPGSTEWKEEQRLIFIESVLSHGEDINIRHKILHGDAKQIQKRISVKGNNARMVGIWLSMR